jgi:hypothetical protein
MKTQREDLLALIEKLPDELLLPASFAIHQLTAEGMEGRKQMKQEYKEICRRMMSSLEDVPTPAGSRPASDAGASWQTDENGKVLNPVFAEHWYEDGYATLVLQMKWTFGSQGFLVLIRTRMSEDGGSYLCTQEMAGPGRSVVHEERFSVLPVEAVSGE